MKKIFTLCVVALMAVTTVKAQHEIGAIVGGLNGASYKYWFITRCYRITIIIVKTTSFHELIVVDFILKVREYDSPEYFLKVI